jgi:hypothetical protein
MTTRFMPRLDILPLPQQRLWEELSAMPDEFVLYGGTAIALHFGHRESVDFDFFSSQALDENTLTLALPFLANAVVTQRAPNTLTCRVERGGPVKLSFFGLPELPRLLPPLVAPDNGLKIASLLDLAGTKAAVVQMRAEAKDYIDLDALMSDGGIALPKMLAAAQAIYGQQFNPLNTLKALCYYSDGNLPQLPEALKARLINAVQNTDLDCLPTLL